MRGVRVLVHRLLLAIALPAALTVARPAAAQDLSCDRGDREVRTLRFTGNREFSATELASTVVTRPSSLSGLPVIGARRCLDPTEFVRDVRRLETLYRRRGFPDVGIDTIVHVRRPGVIDITFSISEGVPMRVTALRLVGLDVAPETREAARDFPLRVGGVFDRGALEAGRDTVLRRLRNLGWPQAEALVAYTTNDSARTAEVEVTVLPGPGPRPAPTAVGDALQHLVGGSAARRTAPRSPPGVRPTRPPSTKPWSASACSTGMTSSGIRSRAASASASTSPAPWRRSRAS